MQDLTPSLARANPRPDPVESWEWLIAKIADDFSVPVERVTRDAWIVRDLEID